MSGARPYLARPFDPSVGLKGSAAFVGFGLGVSTLYALTGIGFPCPFRAMTGWSCPLCGSTRLGAALLHLHPAEAFSYNPLVFVGLALLPILASIWAVELLGGPRLRPPTAVVRRLRRIHPTRWLIFALLIGVVYTVSRNLV